jgi:hypothetical protein
MGNFTDNLKSTMSDEMSKAGVLSKGSEGVLAASEFTRALGEEEITGKKNKKEPVIKRPIKSGVSDNLVGKTKIKKPITKITSFTKGENIEATGAGSGGQFSGPLFSSKENNEDVKKVEATEATGSGSSGSYVTPAAWAKTMNKKDWRGKSKPLIPGGKFVQVKSKCKKFPYCNQGDIKALKIFENETIKKVISKISKERNISENVIKSIIAYEYEKKYLNE